MATNTNFDDPRTIGLSSIGDTDEHGERFLLPPAPLNVPRRRSYPLVRDDYNSSSGCSADSDEESPDNESGKEPKKSPLKKTQSLDHYSPRSERLHGIPLGTPAAQAAAKSFWNMDMLKQSLEKMAQYATEEGTPLGSMESFEVKSQDSGMAQEGGGVLRLALPSQLTLESHSAPNSPKERFTPRIKSPLLPKTVGGRVRPKTPPYMSPGMTRRIFKPTQYSSLAVNNGRPTTPAEQRWLTRVRKDLGDYIISDDGFHE